MNLLVSWKLYFFRCTKTEGYNDRHTLTLTPPAAAGPWVWAARDLVMWFSIWKCRTIIYNFLSNPHNPSLEILRSAWEGDLEATLTAERWKKAVEGAHTASICARHGLIHFKVLHRLHFSEVKRSKMFPNMDPVCDRCRLSPATLAHSFWTVPNHIPLGLQFSNH